MEDIGALVWEGTLNIQVTLNPSLLLVEDESETLFLNIRIPRNTYLQNSLQSVLKCFKRYINVSLDDQNKGMFWFTYDEVPLLWNYPVGTLYDSMIALNPSSREAKSLNDESAICVWKLQLQHGEPAPNGLIPIINGMEQVEKYWFHQWKQVCFILNGSSKQIMTFTKDQAQAFWSSVLNRDYNIFTEYSAKLFPSRPKSIPVMIHLTFPELRVIQSVVKFSKGSDEKGFKLIDLLEKELPHLFPSNSEHLAKAVSHGIEIPTNYSLYELYTKLLSFDGFLHFTICLKFGDEITTPLTSPLIEPNS